MELFTAIEKRSSIRRYQSRPVEPEKLKRILEAARRAPSWANVQSSRYVLVTDTALKEALAQTLPETNPARPAMLQAPLVIVGCAEMGKAGYHRGEASTDKGDWYMFDLGIAMQNLTLAATALGLGTVYVGLFDAARAAQVIGVPEGVSTVAMLAIGYPDQEPKERPRLPLEDVVFYEGYGRRA